MTLSEPFQNTLIWSIFARVPKEQDRRPEGTKRIEQPKDYSDTQEDEDFRKLPKGTQSHIEFVSKWSN